MVEEHVSELRFDRAADVFNLVVVECPEINLIIGLNVRVSVSECHRKMLLPVVGRKFELAGAVWTHELEILC